MCANQDEIKLDEVKKDTSIPDQAVKINNNHKGNSDRERTYHNLGENDNTGSTQFQQFNNIHKF